MNVKISSGKLRFKVSAEELDQLKDGKTLIESLQIGRRQLSLVIDPVAVDDDFIAVLDDDGIRLLVSAVKVKELSDMGRSKEGLSGNQGDLKFSLQVDLRTARKQ